MSISRILNNEMKKSGGAAKVIKVPASKKPTIESLLGLDREISAQVRTNEAMRSKSMQNASRLSRK